MTQIASLLAVPIVFIGFGVNSNIYILQSGRGVYARQTLTTYAGTRAKLILYIPRLAF